jgi:metal-responsive CopG/Arc/MetJ family transcriptional regulator
MPKTRTTVTLDEELLRAVKVRAARTGKGDSEVIEEAIRSHLGLDVIERLWAKADLSEAAAMDLALEAQHKSRRRPR